MANETREQRIEKHMETCKFFNGIQHDECSAGVNYRDLAGIEVGMALVLPCFKIDRSHDTVPCEKLCYPTREESEEREREIQKAISDFKESMIQGKCPTCHEPVHHRQVGHCVYGVECGHRLYQGKANPLFTVQGEKA